MATGAEERVYTGSPDHLGALALARRVRPRRPRGGCAGRCRSTRSGATARFWLRSPVGAPRRGVEGALLRAGPARVPFSWVRDEGSGNSDHREFQLLGLPGAKLGVGAGGEPCRHMPATGRAGSTRRCVDARRRRLARQALRHPLTAVW